MVIKNDKKVISQMVNENVQIQVDKSENQTSTLADQIFGF